MRRMSFIWQTFSCQFGLSVKEFMIWSMVNSLRVVNGNLNHHQGLDSRRIYKQFLCKWGTHKTAPSEISVLLNAVLNRGLPSPSTLRTMPGVQLRGKFRPGSLNRDHVSEGAAWAPEVSKSECLLPWGWTGVRMGFMLTVKRTFRLRHLDCGNLFVLQWNVQSHTTEEITIESSIGRIYISSGILSLGRYVLWTNGGGN